MKGSILIYGSSKANQHKKVEELVSQVIHKAFSLKAVSDPDIKLVGLDADKILTADISSAVKFLQEKPFGGDYKILIILQADKIQPKTQNLLLKALEEPPSYATIILCAKTLQDILDTVQSRCRKVGLLHAAEENQQNTVGYKDIIKMPVGERLVWVEDFAKEEKETIINLLEAWAEEGRGVLKKSAGQAHIKNIEVIRELTADLENTNVNTRLALDYLVMSLESK